MPIILLPMTFAFKVLFSFRLFQLVSNSLIDLKSPDISLSVIINLFIHCIKVSFADNFCYYYFFYYYYYYFMLMICMTLIPFSLSRLQILLLNCDYDLSC